MKKITTVIIFVVFIISSSKAQIIELEAFGPTFINPVSAKHAGDNRLFVIEQDGYIRILNADGTTPAAPFLDIDALVLSEPFERGLLGLAFHPNYATNGYFYIYYTNIDGDSIISRFSVDATDPNLADPISELIVLTVIQPNDAHQGGELVFGSDGYLYIALGDGGNSDDPDLNGQDLSNLLSCMLRVDIDNPDSGKNYGIPSDNPFVNDGDPNTLGEIWGYGLRNPAKFSFDSTTGDMWIADTGQEAWEEINLNVGNASGLNYGWPCYEGNHYNPNNTDPVCPAETDPFPSSFTYPVAEFPHNDTSGSYGCASIGGFRYRGTLQSNLIGTYFYADFCTDKIFLVNEDGLGGWIQTVYQPTVDTQLWAGFAEDVDGELYIMGRFTGQIFKIKQETLGVNEENTDLAFKIFPNPATSGFITILNNGSVDRVNIFNLQGQLVSSLQVVSSNGIININVAELSSGIYIVEGIGELGEMFQKKLIIQ